MKTYKKIIIAGVIVVIIIGAFIINSLSAISNNKKIVYKVNEGATIHSVLNDLEKENIIKNAFIAFQYAKLKNYNTLVAGEYELSSNLSVRQILEKIKNADEQYKNYIVTTLAPGRWAKDYAKIIAEKLNLNEADILRKWNDNTYIETLKSKYWFLKDLPKNESVKVALEGYLAADTYYFSKSSTIEDATELILNESLKRFDDLKSQIGDTNIHTLVTKASLVQFEATKAEDKYKIARVIENRLKNNHKLQFSVTVCYALYEDFKNWKDCETEIDIDSPYNTYKHSGLPVGPIGNPGVTDLQAVLKPANHQYLFFVADVCGDGTVYYSETYEEHQKNVAKYVNSGCLKNE